MTVQIKICGLRRREDIEYANKLRPDFVGFVFAKSRRMVTVDEAVCLRQALHDGIGAVGVFVGEDILKVASAAKICRLDAVQLHGFEDDEYVKLLRRFLPPKCEIWKAVSVRSENDIKNAAIKFANRLLLDAYSPNIRGGTGKRFDWSLIKNAGIDRPFFIAGGINASNVTAAIEAAEKAETTHIFGIDVSGSVETDGHKDFDKMKAVIEKVRNCYKKENCRNIN